MSLLQALRYDLKPSAASTECPSPAADHGPVVSNEPNQLRPETPHGNHQVFEQTSLTQINNSRRILLTSLLLLANLVQMTVNFAGVAGGSKLRAELNVKETYASWIAASYGLTQGTFVLISGRLGDVYSHERLVLGGGIWLSICTLIGAFCKDFFAFVTMRALGGIGGAFIMPNAVAMIASTNPPGRVRNLSLGLFAATAPAGGYFGALLLGVFLEKTQSKWFFVFIACFNAAVIIPLWALSPKARAVDPHGKIDYIGCVLGTSSLILFSFVWNQAPSVGWKTAYEIALLITSVLLFGLFIIWERNFTPHPIMPLDIFKAPSFLTLILVVLLNFMTVGTVIWYQVLWMEEIWHWSPLRFAVGWTPFLICATGAACLAAWLIPRLAAQWILAIGTVTIIISNVLMATAPIHEHYWARMFPSVVMFAFCPDLVFSAAQIIASNSVRRHQQGIAGSIIGTLNLYGCSLGLGFASTVEVEVAQNTGSRIMGYRGALYFALGIALVALILDVFFVRMVKDEREGWDADDAVSVEIELDQAYATGAQVH